jgi:hypothetical protein
MSMTAFVSFRGCSFGASDVIASIFLKHLIDVAQQLGVIQLPWLASIVDSWRVEVAMVGDTGIELDDKWSDAQVEIVVRLIEAACETLPERQTIPRDEIENWEVPNGLYRLGTRGLREMPTNSVIQLGHGIISLLRGTLPATSDGNDHWYYSTKGRKTFAEVKAESLKAISKPGSQQ